MDTTPLVVWAITAPVEFVGFLVIVAAAARAFQMAVTAWQIEREARDNAAIQRALVRHALRRPAEPGTEIIS